MYRCLNRILFASLLAAQLGGAQVLINEVLFLPDASSAESIRTHQWLELYNTASGPVDLSNWIVSGRDGAAGGSARTLPSISLPAGAYLVIHFATGQNQLDFSNGSGDYYTGDDPGTPEWDSAMDEAALYSPAGVVDFVAWATAAKQYVPGAAAGDALAAMIWPAGSYITADHVSSSPRQMPRRVAPGQTIGRDAFSTDTNTAADFDLFGRDALDITPRRRNLDSPKALPIPPKPNGPKAKWTVLLYLAVDNNLKSDGFQALRGIGALVPDPNINYAILVDYRGADPVTNLPTSWTMEGRLSGVDSSTGTIQYEPGGMDDGTQPHQNTGNPDTLRKFIAWAQTAYPADKYAMFIESHGEGWKGIVEDDGSPGMYQAFDTLYMGELTQALDGSHFDLLGFDSCLMSGVEVLAQVAPYADYVVASEEVLFTGVFPWQEMAQSLNATPGQDAPTLGGVIVDAIQARYTTYEPAIQRWAVSLIQTSQISDLMTSLRQWTEQLITGVGLLQGRGDRTDNVQVLIKQDSQAATRFLDDNFVDLGDLATQIQQDGMIPKCVKAAIPDLLGNLDSGAVVKLAHGAAFPNIHGLHVYFPTFRTFQGPNKTLGGPYPSVAIEPYDSPSTRLTGPDSAKASYFLNFGALPFEAKDAETGDVLNAPSEWPRMRTPGFTFVDSQVPRWPKFLDRYYHPVADNHIIGGVSLGGGECSNSVDWINLTTGGTVQLTASGSSDADMPKDTAPLYFFWDTNAILDCKDQRGPKNCIAPTEVSPGQDAALFSNNIKNQDQKPADTAQDDQDESGPSIQWGCPDGFTGTNVITLMAWDDNHTFDLHNTIPKATYVHPQTDSYFALVSCSPGPIFNIYQPGQYYTAYYWPLAIDLRSADGTPMVGMTVSATPSAGTTVSGLAAAGGGSNTSSAVRSGGKDQQTSGPVQVKTDSKGTAVLQVVSTTGGPATVTLTAGTSTQRVAFTVVTPANGPPTGLSLTGPSSMSLNQPVTLTASLLNQDGSTSQVTLLALSNNVKFNDNLIYAGGRGTQANTNSNGMAQVSITATAGGTVQLVAFAGPASKTISIPVSGGSPAPDTLQVSTTPMVVDPGADGAIPFTLLAGSQPVAGAQISIAVKPGAGAISIVPAPSQPNATSLTTDSKGSTTLRFTGVTTGVLSVVATVPGTNLTRTIPVVVNLPKP